MIGRTTLLLGLAACTAPPDLAGDWRLDRLEFQDVGGLLFVGDPVPGSERGQLSVSDALDVELVFEVDTIGAPPPWSGFLAGPASAVAEMDRGYALALEGQLCQGVDCEGQPSRPWTCEVGPDDDWFRRTTCRSPALGDAVAEFLKP